MNFYDTDAVKAMVLNMAVERYELEQSLKREKILRQSDETLYKETMLKIRKYITNARNILREIEVGDPETEGDKAIDDAIATLEEVI